MHELKNIVAICAVILTFVGYVPYIRDILNGKTTPHLYSWFLWGFVTSIAFALQFSDKAGTGAFVTLAAAVMCGVVFFLGLVGKGKKDITKMDSVFIIAAFIALAIWLFAKQPIFSAMLTTLIDLLGFAPTIRKSWNKPFSETLSFYYLNTFRFGMAVFSLQRYTIVTALYPVVWLLGNGFFAVMLVVRRKQLEKTKIASNK
jgi:hypothetical protein